MTLRARLSIVVVLLVGAGLLIADVATYTALRSFLLHRVDQQLAAGVEPASHLLASGTPTTVPGMPALPPGGSDPIFPPGTHAALYDASGTVLQQATLSYGGQQPPAPTIPDAMVTSATSSASYGALSSAGGPSYRAVIQKTPEGTVVVLAIPLTEVQQTLMRLFWIALFVTVVVVGVVALVSWTMVRRGLRPLERIEDTAGAIAAGDLSQRIEDTDPRTEVGRLGGSLNVMLGQIEHAMDEQRASEEALRRFLADASHELRTPLTSIRGYSELYRRGASADPEEAALAMRRIEQEGARMGVLVDDLLFLARAGTSRPIAREQVDLVDLATDAVADARAIDPGRSITLQAPDSLPVTGDEHRLRQVFGNLLSNALTHTPSGTPVTVALATEEDGVEIRVRDDGPGVAPDDAAHVFEPFYRAAASRERFNEGDTPAGAGLGLAIVAAIVEAHGGHVSLESGRPRGSTFLISLPGST